MDEHPTMLMKEKDSLQGCYIDYDSTEGKLKHLKRKFNI